ncbi:SMP-30/gluconolactonase/LRE family protein [Sphingomonas alba]|uniref:SMP-30/gluconolactonase/LRE family protein n=1 Tax=Sphingomonas alba TaxID=2908208 RepID=A0ABT0RJ94_9SPHN|nr:SMP-30/gluconolactonase/LRE family protein [Sphingomonas alba]MCL6682675.1 SMP-30/gluconolactonase/LRE family protein [Sphingomonas alba]
MGSRLAEISGEISCVADVKAILGEGPVWVARDDALYWVDINGMKVFRLRDGDTVSWDTPMKIGSIWPREQGGFIAGTEQGLAFTHDFNRFNVFANPEEALPGNRFNDGKTDREGRFWAGTMDDSERRAAGSLYRVGVDHSVTAIDKGYRVTNGPAFSPDGCTMYESDSSLQLTYAFDLDEAGNASNRRTFIQFGKGDGYPDGMTVDAEGCLWIAFWDGWCVRRFSPAGELLLKLDTPVQRPTSVAFGGEGLETLFITSASRDLQGTDLDRQPLAGGLFAAHVGVSGIAELPFRG